MRGGRGSKKGAKAVRGAAQREVDVARFSCGRCTHLLGAGLPLKLDVIPYGVH